MGFVLGLGWLYERSYEGRIVVLRYSPMLSWSSYLNYIFLLQLSYSIFVYLHHLQLHLCLYPHLHLVSIRYIFAFRKTCRKISRSPNFNGWYYKMFIKFQTNIYLLHFWKYYIIVSMETASEYQICFGSTTVLFIYK